VVVRDSVSGDRPFVAEHSAWGEVTGTGLDWMPFGFAGGIYDPDTGLVRFGARDYDPVVGGWTGKDPIGLRGGAPNLCSYTAGDPVNRIDSTGLLVQVEFHRPSGTVFVMDLDTGEAAIGVFRSGGDFGTDPIELGEYEILEHPETDRRLRLDAVDAKPRNDVHDPSGRKEFRIHGPGRSLGCITALDVGEYDPVISIIRTTRTELVSDNKELPIWRRLTSGARPRYI